MPPKPSRVAVGQRWMFAGKEFLIEKVMEVYQTLNGKRHAYFTPPHTWQDEPTMLGDPRWVFLGSLTNPRECF